MKTKTVYLFDETTTELTGIYEAHESPMEEGVFHTPVFSTDIVPPQLNEGDRLFFKNGEWSIVSKPVEQEVPPTYAELRAARYAKLNQFELISNDAINGTTTHRDAVLAIKAKYPK